MSQAKNISGLVSCIIPVYNREALIIECVKSVLAQSYTNYEIILVDDGSTDDTYNVCLQLAQQYPQSITVLQQSNQGPGAARQTGLNHAKGEYVQFLDSDDLIKPQKFELVLNVFNDSVNTDIVYCVTHYYDIENPDKVIVWKQQQQGISSILPAFFISRAWSTSTPIYKKALLDNTGPILALSCEEDLEYDCRLGLQQPVVKFIDSHLTDFRDHQGQRFSVNHPNRSKQLGEQIQARKHIYQTIEEFGLDAHSDEQKFFSKSMFLLARQSGELGLEEHSILAQRISRQAGNGLNFKDKLALRLYQLFCTVTGRKTGSRLFNTIYSQMHGLQHK